MVKQIYIAIGLMIISLPVSHASQGEFSDPNGPHLSEQLVSCGKFYKPPTKCRRLEKAFGYSKDKRGWEAPKGMITDGASIPTWAISRIGKRFAPEFRKAAVIHDHYVRKGERLRTYLQVQRVFYDILIDSGVDKNKALLMYAAVLVGAPKWIIRDTVGTPCVTVRENCVNNEKPVRVLVQTDYIPAAYDQIDMKAILDSVEAELERGDPSPDQVRDLALRLRLEAGYTNPSPFISEGGDGAFQ